MGQRCRSWGDLFRRIILNLILFSPCLLSVFNRLHLKEIKCLVWHFCSLAHFHQGLPSPRSSPRPLPSPAYLFTGLQSCPSWPHLPPASDRNSSAEHTFHAGSTSQIPQDNLMTFLASSFSLLLFFSSPCSLKSS